MKSKQPATNLTPAKKLPLATKRDLILLAASKLPQPFSKEDLAVAVWQLDKDRFGLQGYRQDYPNNNIVLVNLMGASGLIAKGKIKKVANGYVFVT